MVATIGVDTVQSNRWSGVKRSSKEEILFSQNSSGANKRKIILQKIFGEKNIILKYIVEAQRRKTSIFRKDLAIL